MLEHAMFLAADQQLTGAIMRVPGGIVHVVVALILLVTWIRRSEPGTGGSGTTRRAPPVPPGGARSHVEPQPAQELGRSAQS